MRVADGEWGTHHDSSQWACMSAFIKSVNLESRAWLCVFGPGMAVECFGPVLVERLIMVQLKVAIS